MVIGSPMRVGWLVLAGLLYCVPASYAVIIIEKGTAEPVRGYLVDANETRVIIDVLLPNGETRQRIVPRAKIEEMIQAVSPERLETLRSERPSDYRDYAEELAGKTNDPDAQRMAIRLYQIAAFLAPDKLGRSCLLGMVALARTPEEERKFRAVAFLMDVEHDRSVLRLPKNSEPETLKVTSEQKHALRGLLRALREGRVNDAVAMSKRPALREPLQLIASILTPADFTGLRPGETLPPAVLAKVLAAELSLDPPPAGAPVADVVPPPRGWSRLTDPNLSKPFPALTLEFLTEFNPRECHFRNGKWGT